MTGRRAPGSPRRAPADDASEDLFPTHDSTEGRAPAAERARDAASAKAPQTAGCAPRTASARTREAGARVSHRTAAATAAGARRAEGTRHALGARAEDVVAAYLAARGLEIVARNARVGRLEIDVIARDGPVIVVIEVRTRGAGSYVRALDSVDAGKRARVRRAGAQLWRARFSRLQGVERMRFDVASVTFVPDGEPIVEIVKAAF